MIKYNYKEIFDSQEFQEKYHDSNWLGCCRKESRTVFRLWAPTAEQAEVRIYTDGHTDSLRQIYTMQRKEKGVWEYTVPCDLEGCYYDYAVTVDGEQQLCTDPYARACGLNSRRSMVIDMEKTNPEGWEDDRAPERPVENIIYELHIRDFSNAESSGIPSELRGKYTAFCVGGTTVNGEGIYPTGLDYLKQLGITHVQLMPVMDFGSVDEAAEILQYNWGYDPVHHHIPEGCYSTDPYNGASRIYELKKLIQTLHQNGIRVILDVVYNHTYYLDSCLGRTVPWYFYRQNTDGSASNGSGCGNDLASERSMCARYILESVLYLAEEYHVDGFRFDLMGLLDVDLMNDIRNKLDERWGRGEKLLYGEPWAAASSAVRSGTILADKQHICLLDEEIGVFCDATRDAVMGSMMELEKRGMVNGGGLKKETLLCCLTGWNGNHAQFSCKAPSQTISYLTAHDDWTQWDKLIATLDEKKQFNECRPDLLRAHRMAAAISFCCQGSLFFLAGTEFARTKMGIHNTYNASAEINQLDWLRAQQNRSLVDYYRGWIALRKQLPAFCDKRKTAGERFLSAEEIQPDCVTVLIDNTGESRWNKLFLIVNSGTECCIPLPEGNWTLLADAEDSFRWMETSVCVGSIQAEQTSVTLLGML